MTEILHVVHCIGTWSATEARYADLVLCGRLVANRERRVGGRSRGTVRVDDLTTHVNRSVQACHVITTMPASACSTIQHILLDFP